MTLLGLDFDNTIVRYDKLFHQLALEKGLIEASTPVSKTEIRDHLNGKGLKEQFTLLQGEVYGLKILEAEPAEGMIEALGKLHKIGIQMVLVSHKTKNPITGPAYDLHKSAISWLEKHNFFDHNGLNWGNDNVYFEHTKEMKAKRVCQLNCTYYVDDLPAILNLISNRVKKILYDPEGRHNKETDYQRIESWLEIENVLKD